MIEEKKSQNSKMHIAMIIITIALPLIFILFISFTKYQDFQLLLEIKKKTIMENHSNLANILSDKTYLTALDKQTNSLSIEQVKGSVEELYAYNLGEYALFYDSELVTGTYSEADSIDTLLLTERSYTDKCFVEDYKKENSYYIKSVSKIKLVNNEYILIMTTDTSDLLDLKKKLTIEVVIYSVVGISIMFGASIFLTKRDIRRFQDIDDDIF